MKIAAFKNLQEWGIWVNSYVRFQEPFIQEIDQVQNHVWDDLYFEKTVLRLGQSKW